MNNKKKSYSKYKDLIENAIKEGQQESDFIKETSPYWFRYFHYRNDPVYSFNRNKRITEENLDLFIDRESEIKVISKYIGASNNISPLFHIGLIGSQGCGKHTTLKVIYHIASQNFPEINIEFYDFFGNDYTNTEPMSDKERKMKDDADLDVRIIYCTAKTHYHLLKRLDKYHENTNLLISVWDVKDYLIDADLSINKEIFFQNYNNETIREIFDKRIRHHSIRDEISEEYIKSVETNVLPNITKFASGNLRICFELFQLIHQNARVKGLRAIPEDLVIQIIENLEGLKDPKITEKEHSIIQFYLISGLAYISTPILVQERDFDRSVAWKYLENLTKKGIFHKTYGNPSKYKINDIFVSFYEDRVKKKLIFN